jgi:hypothetical protein
MAPNNLHGPNFELKLLTLFCIRALAAGYKFELSREREDMGGKLDDVIFRYEVADDTPAGKHWRYRYVQAKHKTHKTNKKEKINADHLLPYNSKGDFSLPKYFHSFFNIRARGEDIQNCIICTNIGFDIVSLNNGGIVESIDTRPENILEFGEQTARYKLEVKDAEWRRKLREEWSPVRLLANELKDCDEGKKTTDIRKGTILNIYHVALVNEHVIDCKTKKFHKDFLSDAVNLSEGARELRKTISTLVKNDKWKEWKFKLSNNFGESQSTEVNNPLPKLVEEADIDDYFDKLIFVVDMPNEENFDQIFETEDISKYYHPDKCKVQTLRIINDEIPRAFRDPPANFWLTSEKGKKILLADVTDVSLEYQRQLEMNVGFNDTSIRVMKKKLRQLMESPGNEKVQRIFTPSPQFTAVKVISAIQVSLQELKQEGNYLVVPSSFLQYEEEMNRWKNILKLKKGFHHFLVVVCDDEASAQNFENLFADHLGDTNFGIIISRGEKLDEKKEEIKYTDLTEHFQNKILSKIVSLFQEEEKTLTVRDLVGDKPEEVIDFRSIEELLSNEKEIKIPSFNTSNFEFYIKRRLRFPFDDQFELDRECRISSDGHIEWLIEKEERKRVWEKIKDEISNRASSTHIIVEDSDLIKEKSIVIISEVAGSGKSTILSHFYNEIKKMKPDHWVIRIDLLDRFEELKKFDEVENLDDAVDFLVNQLHVVDEKSSFSRSLLRNRLETGDRIVVMFDGYDEINDTCQEKVILLMKTITKEKLIQLYVTTRPHMLDKLQFELSQLAYSLENFTEQDQINFLVSYWKKELNLSEEYILQLFSASLVERVPKTLNDREKTFFGIPLQIQILALNFQSYVSDLIMTSCENREELLRKEISDLLANQKFDCVSLFERLMEEMTRIFRDKAKATDNDIPESAIRWKIKAIEDHLTRLSIETFVTDQEFSEVIAPFLRPPQSLLWSDKDLADEERDTTSNGLKFGLTIKIGDKIKFLHRTIAEYLFATFLYKGFLLDDTQHNKLLENESIQRLILEEILIKREYDGVQVFFNGMLKRIVDDDEKWRNIKTRHLPDRLNNFIDHFCNRLQTMPTYRFPYRENALFSSLEDGNFKIFTFLCDCLDSTLDETQIETVMMKCFVLGDTNYFLFQRFRTTESKVFERFIGYFKNNTREVLLKLDPFGFYRFSSYISSCFSNSINRSEMYSDWNGKEQKKTVGILLQLIENALSTKDKKPLQNSKMFDVLKNVLTFLMIHENDEHILIKLTHVLAQEIDDSYFAELLKELFCLTNEHLIIRGRIEKVFAILRNLQRNQLLMKIRMTMLKIEPEAFQRFYLPEVEGEDVTAMDLNMLMEPDSYGMTPLHRAALYGDTKEIDKLFQKLNQYQDKETKQVMAEFMIRDEDGFAPFYIATARGHEEICSKMLSFVKQNLPSCITEKHLACRYRFELCLLHDAINSKDIETFQMILKVVKKELGPLELTKVLCHPIVNEIEGMKHELCCVMYEDENRGVKSIFKMIIKQNWRYNKNHTFLNAIVKIAVTRNDGVKDDYTDLYDLIFHNEETGEILHYIDAEDLQGLLSLKGVANFMEQLVNNKNKKNWFQLHSWLCDTGNKSLIGLLRNFTKDQLVQFVDTIPSKNKVTIGREMDKAFFSEVFDYLKKREVGDDCLKKILLYEDRKGFVMIEFSLTRVKRMLTCLSEEKQEEVKQKWNATPMRTFFSLTDLQLKSNELCTARYWTNILMFYLEYGSNENLTEFVEIVTDLLKEKKGRCSVLSFILEKYPGKVTIREILKLVSEKEEQCIFGQNAAIRMMIHEIDEIPFIIKAMLLGQNIDEWLGILPLTIREEIQEFLKLYAPKFIDYAFGEPQTIQFKNTIQTLISFLNYSNEKQLEKFVHNITQFIPNNTKKQKKNNDSDSDDSDSKDSDDSDSKDFDDSDYSDSEDSDDSDSHSTSSTWLQVFRTHKKDSCFESRMKKFMEIVSEKLGSNAVKELILHIHKETSVIFNFLEKEEKMLLEAMLSAEDLTIETKNKKKTKKKQKKSKNKIKAMILILMILFFLITSTTWSRIWNQ